MKKIFLFVAILIATFSHSVLAQVDMSRKIVLTAGSGATLPLRFKAANNGTPVRVKNLYDAPVDITVGTNWTEVINFNAGNGNAFTIYGNIEGLDCVGNPDFPSQTITDIAIHPNSNLKILHCKYNRLTSLNFSNAPQIQEVYCQYNQITNLNIRGCNSLLKLVCYGNRFTTRALDTIYCALPNGSLAALSVIYPLNYLNENNESTVIATNAQNATNKNWKVRYFMGGSPDVIDILTEGNYSCSLPEPNMNKYITLSLSQQQSGFSLRIKANSPNTPVRLVYGNEFRNVFVGTDWSLEKIPSGVSEAKIYGDVTALDIHSVRNKVTGIILTNNPDIEELYSYDIGLTSLDVTNSTKLKKLHCQNNDLTGLNIRNNTQLEELVFFGNQFSTFTIDTIYCALRLIPAGTPQGKCYPIKSMGDNNSSIVLASNAQNATNKNWKVSYYGMNFVGQSSDVQTTGTYVCGTPEPTVNMNKYITLSLNPQIPDYGFKIKAASPNTLVRFVYNNDAISATIGTEWTSKSFGGGSSEIKIYGDVTGLDINNGRNAITGVNLANNADLDELLCANVGLTYLDVTNSSKLKKLHCQANGLTGLNIKNNTQLEELAFFENQFSTFTFDTIYCALRLIPAGTPQGKCYPLKNRYDNNGFIVDATNAQNATSKNWKVLYFEADQTVTPEISTTGTYVCGTPEPSVNIDKYITLTSNQQQGGFSIELKAANPNTLVRFVYGSETKNVIISNNWEPHVFAYAPELKIYGDVSGLNINNRRDLITGIDITNNPDLEELFCANVGLNSLDVTKNTKLKKLHCQTNELTGLNIRNNTQLEEFAFFENQFSTFTFDTIYCALREIPAGTPQGKCYPLINKNDDNIYIVAVTNSQNATNKNWLVHFFESTQGVSPAIVTSGTYACGNPEPTVNMDKYISLSLNPQAPDFSFKIKADSPNTLVCFVYGNNTYNSMAGTEWTSRSFQGENSEIKIYGDVTGLDIKNGRNAITGVDLKKNADLNELLCENVGLTSLDVSNSTKLKKLHCQNNELTGLNIRNNTQLVELVFSDNKFSTFSIDTIYCALRQIPDGTPQGKCCPAVSETSEVNADIRSTNAQNARNKNWQVFYYSSNDNFSPEEIQTNGKYVCGTPEPSVNLNNFIKLHVKSGSNIKLNFLPKADNLVPIRIDAGINPVNKMLRNGWNNETTVKAESNIMTIYGDITGFSCSNNEDNITGIDVGSNVLLEELMCSKNNISSLDVSKNAGLTKLDCSNNNISVLSVENLLGLQSLSCENSNIVSLNISNCVSLENLRLFGNKLTTEAFDHIYCDLPKMPQGKQGSCIVLSSSEDNNKQVVQASNANNAREKGWKVINNKGNDVKTQGTYKCGSPDVNLKNFITLHVKLESKIKFKFKPISNNVPIRIDGGSNTSNASNPFNIVLVDGWNNEITVKAESNIMTIYGDISGLNCGGNDNNITGIDVSSNTLIEELICDNNSISSLDVSKNVRLNNFDCSNNKLTALDVSKNHKLTNLQCYSNEIKTLNVNEINKLATLLCNSNQLTSLNLSSVTLLTKLDCSSNKLISLNISTNTLLTDIDCSNNQLTSLILNTNTLLTKLVCNYNHLTSLDLSMNNKMKELICYNNPFSTKAVNELYCSLLDRKGKENGSCFPLYSANDQNHSTIVAATSDNARNKNWNVSYFVDKINIPSNGNYNCNSGIDEGVFSGISVFPNPATSNVQVQLSEDVNEMLILVDLTGCAVLTADVIAGKANIDVSNLTAGTYFIRVGNKVQKITVE